MKTQTFVQYRILKPSGDLITVVDTWEEVEAWQQANEKEHPDWRITRYKIKQVVTTETFVN